MNYRGICSTSILECEKNYLMIMCQDELNEVEFCRACYICTYRYDRNTLFVDSVNYEIDAAVEIIDVEKSMLYTTISDEMARRHMLLNKERKKVLSLVFPQDYFVFCNLV